MGQSEKQAIRVKQGKLANLDIRDSETCRGCGGIGRRAGFRCLWASARGGSTPLIRISLRVDII